MADGRRWHLFFAWMLVIAIVTYVVAGAIRGDLKELIVRPSDFPKMWPMQAYYLRLRMGGRRRTGSTIRSRK